MLLTLALLASGASAQSQETTAEQPSSVGNPQLRDFQLPGNRTTPPAQTPPVTTQPPAVTPPAATPPAATPPAQTRPTERPAEIRPGIPARAKAPAAPAPAREAAPAAQPPEVITDAFPPPTPLPKPVDVLEALPTPPAPTPAPADTAPVAEAPAPAPSREGFPWLYIGLGAALILGLAAFLYLRRRRTSYEEIYVPEETAAAPEVPAPEVAAPREPAPVAPSDGVVGIRMRPWIELEFRPARAAATETEANVQFELILRNTGSAPAHNVRIEVRMFNAGPDQAREIELFYGEPIRERTPPALNMLPARGEAQLTSAVALPKDLMREVMVQGRRLFIPTVAFNVVYDWGSGKMGQTSNSYVVGREPETPSEKMGAFRLDLGPRLYRSVGQRQTSLARIS